MNLESIIMLREVSRTKSKRGAAEALGSSVDTVSKYIENLERELGVSLIANNGRGCEMTIQGQKVLDHASLILDCLDGVYKIKPETVCPSGEVRIGMTNGISLNLQPYDIDEFYDTYPELKVFSFSMPDVPNLKLNSFDIGITYKIPEGNEFELIYAKEVECGFLQLPNICENTVIRLMNMICLKISGWLISLIMPIVSNGGKITVKKPGTWFIRPIPVIRF